MINYFVTMILLLIGRFSFTSLRTRQHAKSSKWWFKNSPGNVTTELTKLRDGAVFHL